MVSLFSSWLTQYVFGSRLNLRAVSTMSRKSFFVLRPSSLGTMVNSAPSDAMWSSFSRLKASELTIRIR